MKISFALINGAIRVWVLLIILRTKLINYYQTNEVEIKNENNIIVILNTALNTGIPTIYALINCNNLNVKTA